MVNVNIQQAAELVRTGDIASLERLPDSEAEQLATKVDEGERSKAAQHCMKKYIAPCR